MCDRITPGSTSRDLKEIRHFVKETDSLLLRQLSLDYEILDMLTANKQLLVSGGVGSGKTWMALEHAYRLAAAGQNVLFLCYNLNLAFLLKEIVAKRRPSAGSVCVMAWEETGAGSPAAPGMPSGRSFPPSSTSNRCVRPCTEPCVVEKACLHAGQAFFYVSAEWITCVGRPLSRCMSPAKRGADQPKNAHFR